MSEFVFPAAICRDLSEGGDGTRYFGSLLAWKSHEARAKELGWLTSDGKLTPLGRRVGEECQTIPQGRAYFFGDLYDDKAREAVAGAEGEG